MKLRFVRLTDWFFGKIIGIGIGIGIGVVCSWSFEFVVLCWVFIFVDGHQQKLFLWTIYKNNFEYFLKRLNIFWKYWRFDIALQTFVFVNTILDATTFWKIGRTGEIDLKLIHVLALALALNFYEIDLYYVHYNSQFTNFLVSMKIFYVQCKPKKFRFY